VDMDRLARRVSAQLAARPSRRGFVAKLAAGTGAVLAGLQRYEDAAGQTIGNTCCTGASECQSNSCPKGTKLRWSWTCQDRSTGTWYRCNDCNKGQHTNRCVYVTPA
jgi:hypothetical protein